MPRPVRLTNIRTNTSTQPSHGFTMCKYLLFFLFIFSSLSFSAKAEGQNIDSLVNEGKASLFSKDFDTAYKAFHKAFLLDPANLDVSFFLGRAAFEKGDYESALMAFDRILIMIPNAVRVKLEIARCHMRLGAYEVAKQYFYEVLSDSPPDAVKKNIDIYLAAIASTEKRHFLTGMFSLELSFDDNAKTAPNADTLVLPNVGTFSTDSPVTEEIINTTLTATHIYKFEDSKFSWKTTALNFNSFYTSYKDLDLTLSGITTGAAFQDKNYLWEIQGTFNDIKLDYAPYMRQTGATTSIAFMLDPNFLISVSTGFSKKKYAQHDSSDKDATHYTLSVNPILIAGDNRFSFSLGKERENSGTAFNSYDHFKWSLRYDRFLPHNFSIFSSLAAKSTDYDTIKPGESVRRSDTVQVLSLGVTKKLWQSANKRKNVGLQAKHTYTESKSTVATYTYRKNITSTSLSYTF